MTQVQVQRCNLSLKPSRNSVQSQRKKSIRRVLLQLCFVLLHSTSNAFVPFIGRITGARAMSTSSPPSTSSKPLSAEAADNAAECTSNSLISNDNNEDLPSQDQPPNETLLLAANDSTDPSIPRIQLGETITLEEMGPIIINADGSTRRIDNWDQMSKHEQEVAWRRISKRNEARRAALLEQHRLAEEEQQQQKEGE